MQFSGFNLGDQPIASFMGMIRADYPGVHGAVEPPRSISNSGVKRSCGDDSWGVAPCENSAMPGKTFCLQPACPWGRGGLFACGGDQRQQGWVGVIGAAALLRHGRYAGFVIHGLGSVSLGWPGSPGAGLSVHRVVRGPRVCTEQVCRCSGFSGRRVRRVQICPLSLIHI